MWFANIGRICYNNYVTNQSRSNVYFMLSGGKSMNKKEEIVAIADCCLTTVGAFIAIANAISNPTIFNGLVMLAIPAAAIAGYFAGK